MFEESREAPAAPHPVPLRPAMVTVLMPRESPLAMPAV
jgi:hypothetical protein